MGQLIEQPIKSLYQGVSRQPDSVRLPGQVQEADNVLFSVVTGGWSSRPPAEHVAVLDGAATTAKAHYHTYQRDNDERYHIHLVDGDLAVYDRNGNEKSVTFSGSSQNYLNVSDARNDFAALTIADTTFVVNRDKSVEMALAVSQADTKHYAVVHIAAAIAAAKYEIFKGGTSKAAYTASSSTPKTDVIASALATNFNSNTSNHTATAVGSYIYISHDNGSNMSGITTADSWGNQAMKVNHHVVNSTADLLPQAWDTQLVKIAADEHEFGLWMSFEVHESGASHGSGVWKEYLAPQTKQQFAQETMPHLLVRNADGTFTFKEATWALRKVGDEDSNPDPEFVGHQIKDIAFHRDRLVLIIDEHVSYSQAGDYTNFWPDSITQTVDSDPFSRTAGTEKVNVLHFSVPFRKSLFVTSEEAQFEVFSPQALTPDKAVIDASTEYGIDTQCRPYPHGNELYFASPQGSTSRIFAYYYDDNSVSNVAEDISAHCVGYLPKRIEKIVGHTPTNTLFFLSPNRRAYVYVYRQYWDGGDRAQSAWCRWHFTNGAAVQDIAVVEDYLHIQIEYDDDKVHLLKLNLDETAIPDQVCLDRQVMLTGSYDAVADETTFTLPFDHRSSGSWRVVPGDNFPSNRAFALLEAAFRGANQLTVTGDWSADKCHVGITYESDVELSRLHYREDGEAVTTGKLQLKRLVLDYVDTGALRVDVTPEKRSTRTHPLPTEPVGGELLRRGYFRVPAKGNASTLKIVVANDAHLPYTITSLAWYGFFSELSRQG